MDWLTEYTLSGVWRVLQTCGLGLHTAVARLVSPDPDYQSKVRRLHRCLRDAARHPDTVVALFLDEFGYQRWPEVAPTWGLAEAVAQRAGNNQQWRTIDALNALTGQVNYLGGVKVRMSSDSMVSLRCLTLSGERKERSNEYGAEGDQGKGRVVRAG